MEFLVATLADAQTSVRNAAAGALRKLDPEWQISEAARRAIPVLKAALGNKEYWVRQAAADALSRINDVKQSEPSLQAFADPASFKRNVAVDALLQALGDWDRDLRQAAAEALGRINDKRAIPPLVRCLEDADEWVKRSAVQALKALGWRPEPSAVRASPAAAESGASF